MKNLYIHVPFCEKKCFYCSFVIAVGQQQRIDRYLECLEREMMRCKGEHLRTIYIGGGTPTMMNESQLNKLCVLIHEYSSTRKQHYLNYY